MARQIIYVYMQVPEGDGTRQLTPQEVAQRVARASVQVLASCLVENWSRVLFPSGCALTPVSSLVIGLANHEMRDGIRNGMDVEVRVIERGVDLRHIEHDAAMNAIPCINTDQVLVIGPASDNAIKWLADRIPSTLY